MTTVPLPRMALDAASDLWSDLEESMQRRFADLDRGTIRAAVDSVRAQYADVRVRAYLHILAERDAVDLLKRARALSSRIAG